MMSRLKTPLLSRFYSPILLVIDILPRCGWNCLQLGVARLQSTHESAWSSHTDRNGSKRLGKLAFNEIRVYDLGDETIALGIEMTTPA